MDINIGKGITLAVDANALPAEAMAHVVYIGLRNVLMDSHAGVTRDTDGDSYVENSRATAEKKLAALMAGQVRVAGTREGNPVIARMNVIIAKRFGDKWRQSGKKLKDATKADYHAFAATLSAVRVRALAEQQLADERALEVDADVAGL